MCDRFETERTSITRSLSLLPRYRAVRWLCGLQEHRQRCACEAITPASCWAHLRHRFFDLAKDGNASIASETLERIAALYAIEKTIRGLSAHERRGVRQGKSKPLVLALKAWIEHQLARVSVKAMIAEDIRYALNHWDGLIRFLDDGRIELDTNVVEPSIRLSESTRHGRPFCLCAATTCSLARSAARI